MPQQACQLGRRACRPRDERGGGLGRQAEAGMNPVRDRREHRRPSSGTGCRDHQGGRADRASARRAAAPSSRMRASRVSWGARRRHRAGGLRDGTWRGRGSGRDARRHPFDLPPRARPQRPPFAAEEPGLCRAGLGLHAVHADQRRAAGIRWSGHRENPDPWSAAQPSWWAWQRLLVLHRPRGRRLPSRFTSPNDPGGRRGRPPRGAAADEEPSMSPTARRGAAGRPARPRDGEARARGAGAHREEPPGWRWRHRRVGQATKRQPGLPANRPGVRQKRAGSNPEKAALSAAQGRPASRTGSRALRTTGDNSAPGCRGSRRGGQGGGGSGDKRRMAGEGVAANRWKMPQQGHRRSRNCRPGSVRAEAAGRGLQNQVEVRVIPARPEYPAGSRKTPPDVAGTCRTRTISMPWGFAVEDEVVPGGKAAEALSQLGAGVTHARRRGEQPHLLSR